MSPTSGKPFASSTDSRPDPPALFIDRCAWSGALGRALTEAHIEFVAHHDRFEHDAPDEFWLAAAADQGWLVVTRDQRIRYRANELAAMRRARLHVFVFTQGGLTGAETGNIIVRCHTAMLRCAAYMPAPAFFSLTRSGDVNPLKSTSR
jgi:predicted nuclease of predicted toxin-antitoxin system